MGSVPSVGRGTPLAEVLENWKKIPLAQALQKRKLIILCQEEWPFLTRNRGGGPMDEWPPKGTFKPHKQKFLRMILEDSRSQDIDYWYIWYNRAQQRRKIPLLKMRRSLLPLAPEAEETELFSKGVGMYPMRLDYIPNPRAGPGAPAEVPAVTAIMRHEPWKQGDLVAWQSKMPRLHDDAEKCAQLLSGIVTDYTPNWNDMRTLMRELFQAEEREKIFQKDREIAQRGQGLIPWPEQDPEWNLATTEGTRAHRAAIQQLIEAVRQAGERVTNWTKVLECRQRPDEHPSDYWGRLKATSLKYGGMTHDNFQEPLAISVFVDQSAPDISKYFKKHMPGWQSETLAKILSIAAFVFDGRAEERQKQEEDKLKIERK
ncbi:uncharacterized protein ACIBXB_005876 [Morphnus guianensis]